MTYRLTKILAILVLALLPFRADAQTTPGPQGLEPGDQLRIAVYNNEALSGVFTIAADGTVIHPLYRDIRVTGMSLTQVEERLRTFLLKYQNNPQFVIEPLVRVIVGGEVRTPNVFMVRPETTIAQAIALAGGPTERANLNRISVIRERQEIRMDLTRPDAEAGFLQIRSGDQILVGRRGPPFTNILGAVASSVGALAAIISIIITVNQ